MQAPSIFIEWGKPKNHAMKRFYFLLIPAALMFAACGNGNQSKKTEPAASEKTESKDEDMKKSESQISIKPLKSSPKFADASLKTKNPSKGAILEAGKVTFDYEVKNYELAKQTDNAGENGLANSSKGQHIHAILNNKPYMAHYKPGFELDLEDGNYVLLSFLSRSYHESVKSAKAFDVIQFQVGDGQYNKADLTAPHLFYSRPKGSYSGDDTEKILLDFYLVNCTLSKDGYKVKAKINDSEHMLTKWQPYVVEGLEKGKVSIRLELLDADDNTVESPFNPVERTVTLQ